LYNDKHKTGIAMDFALADIQKGITVCRSGVQGKEYETKGGMLWGETKSPGKACPAAFKDALN